MRISTTTLSSGARLLTIGVVLLLCAPLAREQQDERRDGNWWLDLDRAAKLAYITGFLDGINLGRDFTYWGLDKSDETTPLARAIEATSASQKNGFSLHAYVHAG